MTSRQWNTLKPIFAKATRLNPSQREAYLKRICRSALIRQEVESLLAQHDKAENFMGVYSSVGEKILGHYEVLERIGEGGMALIYRARDTRLGRFVALKVLPAWAIGNPISRQRLVREAKRASTLNHPNIVTIHEIAEQNGVDFIVMEYVAGTTLDGRIPSRGLSIQETLNYAVQMVDALARAHAAGILHGDLKP